MRKTNIHSFISSNFFYFAAFTFILSLPFSVALISITSYLIAVQILYPANWKEKKEKLKTEKSLWALSGIFFIYLVGCFFCKDINTGLYEIKKNVFWLIIPFGVALSPKMSEKRFWYLLAAFVGSVIIATFIVAYKIALLNHFGNNVRNASFISHVSFSLLIIFATFIILIGKIIKAPVFKSINTFVVLLFCIWFLFFLGFQKSINGLLSLYTASIVFFAWFIKRLKCKIWRKICSTGMVLVIILPIVYIGFITYNFFDVKDHLPVTEIQTKQGHDYTFNTKNKLKENGHYVFWYVCDEELKDAWNSRSKIKIDDIGANGYRIYDTLLRYMTSKGLRKDSEGVSALTNQDIKNVCNGIANYIFAEHKFSFYPRIYQTIWEIDEYRRTGNPNNQSLSQRVEFIKAAVYIVKNNFWGIGTGNFIIAFNDAYEQINTPLNKKFWLNVHNQYLNYIVKFGIIGFILIIALLFYSISFKKQFHNILLILLLVIIGFANFGETTLETHIGLTFFVFFLSIFIWHSPNSLKSSI